MKKEINATTGEHSGASHCSRNINEAYKQTVRYSELRKMRHARAIATMHHLIACANMESAHRDGWRCDWSVGIDQAAEEARKIEEELWDEIKATYSSANSSSELLPPKLLFADVAITDPETTHKLK
jgi:hypothetical protein